MKQKGFGRAQDLYKDNQITFFMFLGSQMFIFTMFLMVDLADFRGI